MTKNPIKRPSFFWFLSEPGRALIELGIGLPFKSLYHPQEKGDGHPVVVIPGFMSSGRSTKFLRKFITNLGYEALDWGLGRNVGKTEFLELLLERIQEIYLQTGEPVSLVGWSLGGVFARQIAKERPEMIRQVLTMGSPFLGLTKPNNIEWIYRLITGGKKVKNINSAFLDNIPLAAPVPTTAIYTKQDGVVNWKVCMEEIEDHWHQNIEVYGSHTGLGFNLSVLTIIEDRLKLQKNNWKKFKPESFLERNILYPAQKEIQEESFSAEAKN